MTADKTVARFLNKSNWIVPGQEFNGTPCLLWRGKLDVKGSPVFAFCQNGRGVVTTPRQFAWRLSHKRRAERPLDMMCGDSDCCRPSHMRQRERKTA